MTAGESNRSTSSHALNSASSRSHTVFTIHVQVRMLGEGEERALTSKLNLVDLAGSERTKKTGVTGQALKVEHCLTAYLVVSVCSKLSYHVCMSLAKSIFRQTFVILLEACIRQSVIFMA